MRGECVDCFSSRKAKRGTGNQLMKGKKSSLVSAAISSRKLQGLEISKVVA